MIHRLRTDLDNIKLNKIPVHIIEISKNEIVIEHVGEMQCYPNFQILGTEAVAELVWSSIYEMLGYISSIA